MVDDIDMQVATEAPVAAPVETTAAEAASKVSDDKSWYDSLPESLRNNENISKFRGGRLDDFALAYINAVKLIGASPDKVLRLDQAKPIDVLRRLGAPEKPEAYTLKPPEGVPAELAVGEGLDWYKQVAAEAGLLPEQAQKVYEAYVRRVQELEQQAQAQVKEAETALRMKWGQAYDHNINFAKAAVNALGIQEAVASSGLGANPAFIEAMARVGQAMFRGETGPGSVTNAPLPPADAKAEGRRILEQALAAYNAGRYEEARVLQKKAAEYFKMLG